MAGEDFFWLLSWYYSQCDGDWEHGNGVHIRTLDNPGWAITINLEGTELAVRVMEPSGPAGLRASFTNLERGAISPFTGKPVQPPRGLIREERLEFTRPRTHLDLQP